MGEMPGYTYQRLGLVPCHSQEVCLTGAHSPRIAAHTVLGHHTLTHTSWEEVTVREDPSINITTETSILIPEENLRKMYKDKL